MTAEADWRSLMDVPEVQGAMSICELDDGFHIRVTYTCPHCSRRHVQKTISPTNQNAIVNTKCEGGKVKVIRYRR